jgi:hypothetical protein
LPRQPAVDTPENATSVNGVSSIIKLSVEVRSRDQNSLLARERIFCGESYIYDVQPLKSRRAKQVPMSAAIRRMQDA